MSEGQKKKLNLKSQNFFVAQPQQLMPLQQQQFNNYQIPQQQQMYMQQFYQPMPFMPSMQQYYPQQTIPQQTVPQQIIPQAIPQNIIQQQAIPTQTIPQTISPQQQQGAQQIAQPAPILANQQTAQAVTQTPPTIVPNQFMPALQTFIPQQQFQQTVKKQIEEESTSKLKMKGKLKLNSKQFEPTKPKEGEKSTETNKDQLQQVIEEKTQKEEAQLQENNQAMPKIENIKQEPVQIDKDEKSAQTPEISKEIKTPNVSLADDPSQKFQSPVESFQKEELKSQKTTDESPSQSNISQLLMNKRKAPTVAAPVQETAKLNISDAPKVRVIISTQVFVKFIQEGKDKPVTNERLKEIINRPYKEVKEVKSVSSPGRKYGKKPAYQQHEPTQKPTNQQTHVIQREPVSEDQLKMKSQVNKFITAKREEENKDQCKKDKKNLKFALNKLCPDNLEAIKADIEPIVKINWKYCVYFVKIVIEKAWTEKKYAQTYAKLCFYLMKKIVMENPPSDFEIEEEFRNEKGITKEEVKEETIEEVKEQQPPVNKQKKNIFKWILLKNIQQMFEDQKDISDRKQLDESLKKQRILGNVQFIGELFQEGVISAKVIFICVIELMRKLYNDYLQFHEMTLKNEKVNSENTYELDLEGIYTLFDQFGEKISESEKKKKEDQGSVDIKQLQIILPKIHLAKTAEQFNELKNELNKIFFSKTIDIENLFSMLDFFQDKAKIQLRIKCLLQNLKALKQSDWRKVFKKEGPKKVSEIHQEFYDDKEKREEKAKKYYDQEKQSKHFVVYQEKKAPNFQITMEQTEQKEVEDNNNEVYDHNFKQTSLTFSRDFSYKNQQPMYQVKAQQSQNQQQQQQQQQPVEKGYSYADIESQLYEMFKNFDNGVLIKEDCELQYDIEAFYEDCLNLCKKSKFFISCFLSKFCDVRSSQLKQLVGIPLRLLENNIVSPQDFIGEFNVALKKLWLMSEDIPLVYQGLQDCFIGLIEKNFAKFEQIETDIVNMQDEEQKEMADVGSEFLEKLIRKCYDSLLAKKIYDQHKEDFLKVVAKAEKQKPYLWLPK